MRAGYEHRRGVDGRARPLQIPTGELRALLTDGFPTGVTNEAEILKNAEAARRVSCRVFRVWRATMNSGVDRLVRDNYGREYVRPNEDIEDG